MAAAVYHGIQGDRLPQITGQIHGQFQGHLKVDLRVPLKESPGSMIFCKVATREQLRLAREQKLVNSWP